MIPVNFAAPMFGPFAVLGIALASFVGSVDAEVNPYKDEKMLREELEDKVELLRQVWVPMRDGVRLSTDIYLPKDRKGKVPVVFWRTPYDYDPPSKSLLLQIHHAVDRGYAFVVQNERGKFFSEGEWEILGRPQTDGVDALDWLSSQEWSSGRVGLLGCSSPAEWQLALAALNHPALAAMVPAAPGAGIGVVGEYYEQGNWYRGGAEQMFYSPWLHDSVQPSIRPTFVRTLSQEQRIKMAEWFDLSPDVPETDWKKIVWTLPLEDMSRAAGLDNELFSTLVQRNPASPEWRDGGLFFADSMQINVPALWLFSWYDVSIAPNLALYQHARDNKEKDVANAQFLSVGPGLHCRFWSDKIGEVGEREYDLGSFDAFELVYGFFDRYVKGESNRFDKDHGQVQYYDLGEGDWKRASTWPPEGARRLPLFLSSGGSANSVFGNGTLSEQAPSNAAPSDQFTYDPANPVPSRGGGICCIGDAIEGGAFDQRSIEARADVLVFSTEPLEQDVIVAGPVDVELYVESDAPDTDFTVKLVDVFPDGRAFNLDETIQRVRWRNGYTGQGELMVPGEIYGLRFQPMTTANRFKQGHRIRLEVSSSNFPRFARNLNSGGRNFDEEQPRVAVNTVHHSDEHPSVMTLTVLPE